MLSKRGATFKLACLGKQDSDENPLMRKVAIPLKLAQAQVSGVGQYLIDSAFVCEKVIHKPRIISKKQIETCCIGTV